MIGLAPGARRIDQAHGVAGDLLGDGDLAHELLDLEDGGAGQHARRLLGRRPGRARDDADLFVLRQVGHHDVEHEPIELRLGQRVGAFQLDRVLRREDEERPLERIRPAGGGHVVLLHRLEQRRLRLGRCPVDLVGQDDLGEDRPRHEAKRPMPRLFVEDLGAGDVGRHQVRRELDPLERQIEDLRDGLDQQRLGQSGHAGDQAMAAGEQRHQHLVDDFVLADDDLADLGENPRPPFGDAFGNLRDVRLR